MQVICKLTQVILWRINLLHFRTIYTMKKIIFIPVLCVLGFGGFFTSKLLVNLYLGTPDITNGQTKYQTYCLACHGDKGHGDGVASAALTVKPDSLVEELSNPWGFKLELIYSVLDGDNGQDGLMPAFKGTLTKKDINDIFGYIENINQS